MDQATGKALSDIRDALQGHVDGVVAAQMFQADGTWTGEAGGGLLGRLFGGGKDDDGPPGPQKFNLVALTADRVHVLGAKPKSGRWKVTEPVGDWAVSDLDVHAHSKRETWRTHEHMEGPTDGLRSADTIKVGLHIRPEGRTLKLEGTVWDGDRLTQETVDALLAATGGKPLEQADDELFEEEFGRPWTDTP